MTLDRFYRLSTQKLRLLGEVAVDLRDHCRVFVSHQVCRRDGIDAA